MDSPRPGRAESRSSYNESWMGQAIVYCWKCQKQLRSLDFEQGRAIQVGDRASCAECSGELLATLHSKAKPPDPASGGDRPTSKIPSRETPRKGVGRIESSRILPAMPGERKGGDQGAAAPWRKPALIAGGIALLAILGLLWSQGEKGDRRNPPESGGPPSGSSGQRGASDPEKLADQAITKARNAASSGRDLDGQILLWDEALKASERTSRNEEARREREILLGRRKEAYSKELSQIEESILGLLGHGESTKAVEFLRSARKRHEGTEWTVPVDRLLAGAEEKLKAGDAAERDSRAAQSVPQEGLVLWLRGDTGVTLSGTRVSRWMDQSGNHRDASQENASCQPLLGAGAVHGKPALGFDGSKTCLKVPLPVNGLGGMTLFLVSACARQPGGTGSDSSALYWDAAGPNGKMYLAPFQTRIRFKFGSGKPNRDFTLERPSSITNLPTLTVLRKDGPSESLYTDGRPAFSQTGGGTAISECRDECILGIGKNNTHFSGGIAELLIFKRALDDPERQRVERYLMEKYSLPAK